MADSSPIDRAYRRILAWVEFDATGEAAARRALHLARMTRARLVLFHAIPADHNVADGYPVPSRESVQQHFESAAMVRLTHLASRLGAAEAECQARYGQPGQAFDEYARQWAPDLVVAPASLSGRITEGRWDVLAVGGAVRSTRGRLARFLDWALASA